MEVTVFNTDLVARENVVESFGFGVVFEFLSFFILIRISNQILVCSLKECTLLMRFGNDEIFSLGKSPLLEDISTVAALEFSESDIVDICFLWEIFILWTLFNCIVGPMT